MCAADVTAISLVTNTRRDDVSRTLIPYMSRALSNQRVSYQRLPITRDHIDWVLNDRDQLTVALDDVDGSTIVMIATRGEDNALCAARLANLAAEFCSDYGSHTVFWNGSDTPIPAEALITGNIEDALNANTAKVIPRKVRARGTSRRASRSPEPSRMDGWMVSAMRAHVLSVDENELAQMEMESRRAKSAPLRLSAWAMSISTALIAAPLALPLIAHNLTRGEDLKAGGLALGVAGLFATLSQTGLAPGLELIL